MNMIHFFPFLLTMTTLIASAANAEYPQLIATRYAQADSLPPEGRRPTPVYDFVDRAKLPGGAQILSAAKAANGSVWVVTDKGAFRSANGSYQRLDAPRLFRPHQPDMNPDTEVRAVAADADGHVWLATTAGLYATDGADWWQALDRRDGVPFENLTCLHLAANGDLWCGTPEGAWRLRNGQFRFFSGKRWLPGNRVSAIWTDAKGRAWIETDGGTGGIEEKPVTLAEKAAHYNRIVRARHLRRGFLNEATLKTPGDPAKEWVFHVSDNDGEWTSLFVGALCFRYAATRDPEAREMARSSLKALMELERLTGIPGYPARAVVTDEELQKGLTGVDFEDKVRVPGETDRIWFRSPVEKNVWCKGDTSSDEMDGHYFAWYLYHDLVADAAEKREIAALVRRATDHIMQNGYVLVGHTGRRTRWGVWSPELLNDDPNWWEQRPLNSLEILSYLKIAHHVTGDQKYARACEELITKHHYLINSLTLRRGQAGQWHNINHADDEMIYRTYYVLLQLEKDPARRRILLQGLSRTWEETPGEQSIRAERNPLFHFIYGACTGKPSDTESAVATLREWPWELVRWSARNSQRHDVTMKAAPGVSDRKELDRVLSPIERPLARLDTNPWVGDGGDEGRMEDDGNAWLLGYWIGVYHGFIAKGE